MFQIIPSSPLIPEGMDDIEVCYYYYLATTMTMFSDESQASRYEHCQAADMMFTSATLSPTRQNDTAVKITLSSCLCR